MADCISDRIDYALNPDKTNDGKYVSSYRVYLSMGLCLRYMFLLEFQLLVWYLQYGEPLKRKTNCFAVVTRGRFVCHNYGILRKKGV